MGGREGEGGLRQRERIFLDKAPIDYNTDRLPNLTVSLTITYWKVWTG